MKNKRIHPNQFKLHYLFIVGLTGLLHLITSTALAQAEKWTFTFPYYLKSTLILEISSDEAQGEYLKAMEMASLRCLKALRPQRIINEDEAFDLVDICSNPKVITR